MDRMKYGFAVGVVLLAGGVASAQTVQQRNFRQNNYGVRPVVTTGQVQTAQQVAQLPPVAAVPAPYPYPYPYPYPPQYGVPGQPLSGVVQLGGVQPFPGYCPYQGYPTCGQQVPTFGRGGNPAAQSIVGQQRRPAGGTSLGVKPGQAVFVPSVVDPAVYQRGQSPVPGDGGIISKLNNGSKAGGIRNQILKTQARRIGIEAGYVEESQRINVATTLMSSRLDRKYNFKPLMIEGFIIPPVISEASKIVEKGSDRLLYLSLGAFEVVKEARLSADYPNWRHYLLLPGKQAKGSRFPLSDYGERKVWNGAYRDGYMAGKREAREAFRIALNRLDRDYRGMATYHRLAKTGAVTVPTARFSDRAVRILANGKKVAVEESIIHLKVNTRFKNTRRKAYKVTPSVSRVIVADVTVPHFRPSDGISQAPQMVFGGGQRVDTHVLDMAEPSKVGFFSRFKQAFMTNGKRIKQNRLYAESNR